MAEEEISPGSLTEADTCRLFVTPALHAAGWKQREENVQAWKTTAEAVAANGYNLDLKNPHAKAGLEYAGPKDLVASMRAREQDVMRLLAEIEALVSEA